MYKKGGMSLKMVISKFLHILSLTPWISLWLIIADGHVFPTQYPQSIKGATDAGSSFKPLTLFYKFSCWCFLDLTEWQEEEVFIHQPEWIVLSQMTIELLVD